MGTKILNLHYGNPRGIYKIGKKNRSRSLKATKDKNTFKEAISRDGQYVKGFFLSGFDRIILTE